MIVRFMFCKGARLKAFSTGMLMVLDKLKSNIVYYSLFDVYQEAAKFETEIS